MAARRLIAILLVLLFLSSLAAALAPVQEGTQSDSSSTSSESTVEAPTLPAESTADPRRVSQTVSAAAKGAPPVRVRVGDRLELKVTSRRAGTLELVDLGPTEDVGPRQPAFFDVLLREEGSHPVRYLGTERDVAFIKVAPPSAPDR